MPKRRYFYVAYALLSAFYIIVAMLAPLSASRFNLSPAKTHALQLSIYLPLVLIWGVAIYGAERFKSYTASIKKYDDGRALDTVANGFIILVAAIIFNSMFGLLRAWARQDNWLSPFTISANYLSVILPLIAYSFMYAGSRKLRGIAKVKRQDVRALVPMAIILVVIAGFYISKLFAYDYIEGTPDPGNYSSFYMSKPMVLLTLAIPYLLGWTLALKAALNIAEYRLKVKGIIYKGALFRLSVGTFLVVAFYVLVQFLIAFSTFFARAGLASILAIVYLLILLYAAGFLIIASGTKKLVQIEKVR
jgi:hypothetical protein